VHFSASTILAAVGLHLAPRIMRRRVDFAGAVHAGQPDARALGARTSSPRREMRWPRKVLLRFAIVSHAPYFSGWRPDPASEDRLLRIRPVATRTAQGRRLHFDDDGLAAPQPARGFGLKRPSHAIQYFCA